jgi:hypothetical protein
VSGASAPGGSTPDASRAWFGAAIGMFAVGWGANQFVSMLVAYKSERGISTAVNDGLFGIYAVALIVALLLCGPAADLWGRARVVRPAVALSLVASVVLMTGTHSVPLLFLGRFLGGVASGAIFAAGSAWVKELSVGDEGLGARRAALSLSLGFGVGPLAAGVVAQWAPHPLVLAYVPHLVIATVALPLVWRVPESLRPENERAAARSASYRSRLRVPAASHRRFLRVVLPAALWVFAAPAVAFAVLPSLVSGHVGGYPLLFSAGLAGLTLGTGVAVQPIARRLDAPGRVTGALLGLGVIVVGMVLAAIAAGHVWPVLALVAAMPLGAGYGLGLVSGLLETQRIAAPDELAGLTAVYYSLTYVGFALPLVLAWLHPLASYETMIGIVAVVAAVCVAIVWRGESAAEVR